MKPLEKEAFLGAMRSAAKAFSPTAKAYATNMALTGKRALKELFSEVENAAGHTGRFLYDATKHFYPALKSDIKDGWVAAKPHLKNLGNLVWNETKSTLASPLKRNALAGTGLGLYFAPEDEPVMSQVGYGALGALGGIATQRILSKVLPKLKHSLQVQKMHAANNPVGNASGVSSQAVSPIISLNPTIINPRFFPPSNPGPHGLN